MQECITQGFLLMTRGKNGWENLDFVCQSQVKSCNVYCEIIDFSSKYVPVIPTALFFFPDLSVWIPSPVTEGSEVKLSCRHTCSSPSKPTVMWKKNGEELPGKQTDNSELLLQGVSMEDEGHYSCVLKGYEAHPSTPVKLNVMCEY